MEKRIWLTATAMCTWATGDGTFKEIAASGYIVTTLADINGDGVPDEVGAMNESSGGGHVFQMTGLALGNGDGTFGPFQGLFTPSTTGLFPSLAADMNGDGKKD